MLNIHFPEWFNQFHHGVDSGVAAVIIADYPKRNGVGQFEKFTERANDVSFLVKTAVFLWLIPFRPIHKLLVFPIFGALPIPHQAGADSENLRFAESAIKNIIPALGNEIITVIKETAIVSMVGMYDLNMAAKDIGSGQNMASYIVPMFVAALFYLVTVYLITFIIKRIEKQLRKSEMRG